VVAGTPLFSIAVFNAIKACIASGIIIAGFVIRACMIAFSPVTFIGFRSSTL
jgi:hypothetical protein